MVVVDTHCHASPYWFEPVEILLDQMTRNDVDKAVLIQVRGVFDNSYLMECVHRFPGRFSAVVVVDTEQPDALERLEQWAEQGAEGLRLGPTMRSRGRDPLAIWRKAADLGLVVSLLGTVEEFASPDFENIVKGLPSLSIIMEHLGGVGAYWGPGRRDPAIPYPAYQKVLALAQYPNTFMKTPGFGEFCPRPAPFRQPMPFQEVPPLVEMAVEAFGANRLMWGSDFPPVANREGYRNALRFPMEGVRFNSQEDKELVFGQTATNLFKFPG